jgi:hypothetical protein
MMIVLVSVKELPSGKIEISGYALEDKTSTKTEKRVGKELLVKIEKITKSIEGRNCVWRKDG